MGKLTHHLPKPLLPYRNATILDHIISWIRGNFHFEIVISAGYLSERIEQHVKERYSVTDDISVVKEPYRLGTGGAIKFAVAQSRSDIYVVVNGDTLHTFSSAVIAPAFTMHHQFILIGTRVSPMHRTDCDYFSIDSNKTIRSFHRRVKCSKQGEGIAYSGICVCRGDAYQEQVGEVFDNTEFLRSKVLQCNVGGIVTEGDSFDLGTLNRYLSSGGD